MSENAKQDTQTEAADAATVAKLGLNKETVQDLDASAGDVKGGFIMQDTLIVPTGHGFIMKDTIIIKTSSR